MKVWNLMSTRADADDWSNVEASVVPFGTESEARAVMKEEFNKALSDARVECLNVLCENITDWGAEIRLAVGARRMDERLVWSISPKEVKEPKGVKAKGVKKAKKPAPRRSGDEWRYKVRAAITLAHYLFVYDAASPDEAEQKARSYIMDIEKNHGGYDWYGEASHMHTTFEVEEAE